MSRVVMILFCGLMVLSATSCAFQPTPIAKFRNIELDDLWEDTPTTKDLSYAWRVYRRYQLPNHLHEQLRLYLTCPEDWQRGDRRPAIVFIHGGGWGQGDADQWFPQCRYFALRGLVGVSVNYRLKSDTTTIVDCVIDCKSAIRYLRKNAGKLGIDPEKIIVVGESAGGHIAAALGTIEEYDAAGDDVSISPVPNVLILLNPITDMTTHWGDSLGSKARSLSPLHHISKKTPPTLLIHGDSDTVVDIQHSRAFHEKMIFLGNYSRLLVLPGADHAFAVFKYGPENFNKQAIIEMDHFLVSLGYLDGNAILHTASNPKAVEGY